MIKAFKEKLFKPIDAITAEIFIRFFGVIIFFQVLSFQKFDFLKTGILQPKFLFTYDFFGWVKPLPASMINVVPLLLIAASILIIINKFRKIALAVFLLVFSYLFLLEKSYYNNHFYLMMLIALCALFYTPVKNNSDGKSYIPYWFLLLLQFHIALVYFYGGLAKLNVDWLINMQPMKTLLDESVKNALIPSINKSDWVLYVLTYGGVLFDLSIAFLLWIKNTRKLAILACIVFNVFNFLLFNFGAGGDIGVFPFMMMGACLLFVDPDWVRQKVSSLIPSSQKSIQKNKKLLQAEINFSVKKNMIMPCLIAYTIFHLLFPFRHLLYSGNSSWTGKAHRFGWRMKMHTKKSSIKYYYALQPQDTLREVNMGSIINTMQRSQMAEDPVMLLQFANFLGNDLKKAGYKSPVITASAWVSLNAKPKQQIVDSTLNLLTLKHNVIGADEWILGLKE